MSIIVKTQKPRKQRSLAESWPLGDAPQPESPTKSSTAESPRSRTDRAKRHDAAYARHGQLPATNLTKHLQRATIETRCIIDPHTNEAHVEAKCTSCGTWFFQDHEDAGECVRCERERREEERLEDQDRYVTAHGG